MFALRFGHVRTDDGEHISQDAVRAAFNSPFRPFVLTSTSIGQEGLDFHPWCHRLVHWNLPGNPVDFEQREGRIHRYKGHAVRRNVAGSHAGDAFASWRAGEGKDIWKLIFDLADSAARDVEKSDLVPHWIAPGEHRVERHVPQLPYTAVGVVFLGVDDAGAVRGIAVERLDTVENWIGSTRRDLTPLELARLFQQRGCEYRRGPNRKQDFRSTRARTSRNRGIVGIAAIQRICC